MKTSIILAIAFAFVISLGLVGSARCDGTVISISPSSSTLPQSQIGANFRINITISGVTSLWSWKVRLNWNPNVLNFTNIDNGPFLESAGSTLFPPPPQRNGSLTEISDTLLKNSSVSGSGTLATVTFKILAAGQSDITLNETELLGPLVGQPPNHLQIVNTVNNGKLTVLPEFQYWAFPAIILVATIPVAILAKKRLKPAT